jgi:hypothetical protein
VNYAGRSGYYASYYDNSSYATDAQITIKYRIPNCSNLGSAPASAPAQPAPSSGTYLSRGDTFRFCVNTGNAGCRPPAAPSIGAGSRVSMVCWQDGSNYTGDYTTNRWFWVTASNGLSGFVTASIVRNQTSVPACSTKRAIVAASTAASRYGQVKASTADAQLFTASEWGSPYAEWAGDCPKLPYVGWHAAGVNIRKNNAIDNYNYYASRGAVHSGVPPVGAVVFYRITRWGHEAISVGDGLIATTVGLDGDGSPNTIKSYALSNYLGWVMPA